jgi:hypothetical protein
MQFRSERDQHLAIKVISQMIDLVDSLLQRMYEAAAKHGTRLISSISF